MFIDLLIIQGFGVCKECTKATGEGKTKPVQLIRGIGTDEPGGFWEKPTGKNVPHTHANCRCDRYTDIGTAPSAGKEKHR